MMNASLSPIAPDIQTSDDRELTDREATDALERALARIVASTSVAPAAGWVERASSRSPLHTRSVRP